MTMTVCQIFLPNLPKNSWGDWNVKSVEFKNMEDSNKF